MVAAKNSLTPLSLWTYWAQGVDFYAHILQHRGFEYQRISRFTKSRFDERLAAQAAHDFAHLRFR